MLERVQAGELPFDRTIKVSLTERLTKEQISARMPHNLPTMRAPDGGAAPRLRDVGESRGRREEAKADAQARFIRRRRKMLKLVEELSLRTRRVQPLMRQLEELSRRHGSAAGAAPAAEGRRAPRRRGLRRCSRELRSIMLQTLESPAASASAAGCSASSSPSTSASSASCPAATCGWSCRSPRSTATAA